MPDKFRIGLFTSAWDVVAWELVEAVYKSVQTGFVPNAETPFVFCSREQGETSFGDLMIRNVTEAGLPLVTFSSLKFQPESRRRGREAEKAGDPSFIQEWWRAHDAEIVKRIQPADLDVTLGWMWIFSPETSSARRIINLHPALPTGPKGTYKDVIWQLIGERARETGVMMHLLTSELDRGPSISFCRFPIRGEAFDPLWDEMERRLAQEPLQAIRKREEETNPLFTLIRQRGVVREFPLLLWAIKRVAEGGIRIENGKVLDAEEKVLADGCDLSEAINTAIAGKP